MKTSITTTLIAIALFNQAGAAPMRIDVWMHISDQGDEQFLANAWYDDSDYRTVAATLQVTDLAGIDYAIDQAADFQWTGPGGRESFQIIAQLNGLSVGLDAEGLSALVMDSQQQPLIIEPLAITQLDRVQLEAFPQSFDPPVLLPEPSLACWMLTLLLLRKRK